MIRKAPIKPTKGISRLAQMQANAIEAQGSTVPKLNVKAPISEPDQETIRQYLGANCPEWLGVYYELGIQTAQRTADLANLRWENVVWADSMIVLQVSKQTRSAQARAYSKGLKEIREARQDAALASGDGTEFMKWAKATREELEDAATDAEIVRCQHLVSTAKRKIAQCKITPELLARLKAMKEAAFWDDGFIFSRALTTSNSTRLDSGKPITRQTFWARFKGVFAACAAQIATAVCKLSAYSLRKTACRNVYERSGHNIAAVMRLTGHASQEMALRYLGVEDELDRILADAIGVTTA